MLGMSVLPHRPVLDVPGKHGLWLPQPVSWRHGGVYEISDWAIVHKVPADIPPEKAALIEPLACSIHAVQRGEIEFGDVVVIAGAGTLGLGMLGAARLKNPGMLIAVDIVDYRLDIAKNSARIWSLTPNAKIRSSAF